MSTLTPSQELALHEITTSIERGDRLVTLTGYAGAGKTFLVGELIRRLAAPPRLAATTHRAAAVLASKCGQEVATIHSLLGLRLKQTHDGKEHCVADGEPKIVAGQVVIIDEASMVGADLLGHIVRWASRVQFIFVGDDAQLPPVGEKTSRVFALELATQVHLTGIVRQAAENPIIQLAQEVRQCGGIYPREQLLSWATDDGPIFQWSGDIDAIDSDAGLVAYRNVQVSEHNRRQHRLRYPDDTLGFAVGESVLFNEAHELPDDIFIENNAAGVVVGAAPARYFGIDSLAITLDMDQAGLVRGYVPRRQEEYETIRAHLWKVRKNLADEGRKDEAQVASKRAWAFSKSFLPLRHTYASTTHKAQGATHHTTIIDVNDLYLNRDAEELRKLLYTAITRPSEQLVLWLATRAPGAGWQQRQEWVRRWQQPQEDVIPALGDDLWRRVLTLVHPDKHGNSPLATRTFQELMNLRQGGING